MAPHPFLAIFASNRWLLVAALQEAFPNSHLVRHGPLEGILHVPDRLSFVEI